MQKYYFKEWLTGHPINRRWMECLIRRFHPWMELFPCSAPKFPAGLALTRHHLTAVVIEFTAEYTVGNQINGDEDNGGSDHPISV